MRTHCHFIIIVIITIISGGIIACQEGSTPPRKSLIINNKSFSKDRAAFVNAMNKKAHEMGATTASFLDASGLKWSGSVASANDILQILVHAAGIPQIAEKWNKEYYVMTVSGHSSRNEVLSTSVNSIEYDDSTYPILGGKTGTITATGNVTYNLAWITLIENTEIACVIMGDTTDVNRWQDAERIAEYLDVVMSGKTATLQIDAPLFAACKLPAHPIMYDNYKFDLLASKSPDETGIPASLTKLMALITAFDYISDENEQVKIDPSDIIGGSGDNLVAGDIVSIRDLVYDMLLPSSNDAAMALARHIGGKIIKMHQ